MDAVRIALDSGLFGKPDVHRLRSVFLRETLAIKEIGY